MKDLKWVLKCKANRGLEVSAVTCGHCGTVSGLAQFVKERFSKVKLGQVTGWRRRSYGARHLLWCRICECWPNKNWPRRTGKGPVMSRWLWKPRCSHRGCMIQKHSSTIINHCSCGSLWKTVTYFLFLLHRKLFPDVSLVTNPPSIGSCFHWFDWETSAEGRLFLVRVVEEGRPESWAIFPHSPQVHALTSLVTNFPNTLHHQSQDWLYLCCQETGITHKLALPCSPHIKGKILFWSRHPEPREPDTNVCTIRVCFLYQRPPGAPLYIIKVFRLSSCN